MGWARGCRFIVIGILRMQLCQLLHGESRRRRLAVRQPTGCGIVSAMQGTDRQVDIGMTPSRHSSQRRGNAILPAVVIASKNGHAKKRNTIQQSTKYLQCQQNEWACKKSMTQYSNQPPPHASVLGQNGMEEEKPVPDVGQRGRTEWNGLFPTILMLPPPPSPFTPVIAGMLDVE